MNSVLFCKAEFKVSDRDIEVIALVESIDKDNDLVLVDGFNHDYLMTQTPHESYIQHNKSLAWGIINKSETVTYAGKPAIKQTISAYNTPLGDATLAGVKAGIFPNVSIGAKPLKKEDISFKNGVMVVANVYPDETSVTLPGTQKNYYAKVLKSFVDGATIEQQLEMANSEILSLRNEIENKNTMLRNIDSKLQIAETQLFLVNLMRDTEKLIRG